MNKNIAFWLVIGAVIIIAAAVIILRGRPGPVTPLVTDQQEREVEGVESDLLEVEGEETVSSELDQTLLDLQDGQPKVPAPTVSSQGAFDSAAIEQESSGIDFSSELSSFYADEAGLSELDQSFSDTSK